MKTESKNQNWYSEYFEFLKALIKNNAINENKEGLRQNAEKIIHCLKRLDFKIEYIQKNGYSDILLATRAPICSNNWIGMYGHYDVSVTGKGWNTPPTDLTQKDNRLYGRGIGDNLGPLALRLICLQRRNRNHPSPGIVWLFQGEEEIGSPFAHQIFPILKFPEVRFWIEETGYFNNENEQRLLIHNPNEDIEKICLLLAEMSLKAQKSTYREVRFLNKAFGNNRCPFLNHIVKEQPYIAFGPNDDLTTIHAPNESIPENTLELSFVQFDAVLDEVSQWN